MPSPLKRPRSIGHGEPLAEIKTGYPLEYSRATRSPAYSPTYPQAPAYSTPIDPRLTHPIRTHEEQRGEDATTATDTLLQTPVYNSHEALLTLIEAAGKDTPLSTGHKSNSLDSDTEGEGDEDDKGPGDDRRRSGIEELHQPSPNNARGNAASVRFSSNTDEPATAGSSHASSHVRRRAGSNVTMSPGMASRPGTARSLSISTIHESDREGLDKSIRAWNKFRFVKAGWFTAREAIAYVE
jgi:hypothetical protein